MRPFKNPKLYTTCSKVRREKANITKSGDLVFTPILMDAAMRITKVEIRIKSNNVNATDEKKDKTPRQTIVKISPMEIALNLLMSFVFFLILIPRRNP